MKDDDKSQPYKVDPEMSPKTEESLQQELRSKNVAELCKNESSGSSLDTLPSKFSPSASGTSDGSQSEERKADDEFKNRSKLGHSRMAIRSLILSEYLAGHRPSEAVENVRARSTRKNLGYDTVRAWYKKFDEGDTNLSDGPRSGRPAHVDVQKVKEYITEDPRRSTRELAEYMNCHHNTIERILHSQLNLEYSNGCWLPKATLPDQDDEPAPSGLCDLNRTLLKLLEDKNQETESSTEGGDSGEAGGSDEALDWRGDERLPESGKQDQ